MRSYLPIARATFMIGLVYRFGFLFNILGNIVYLGVAYYLWKSIYSYSDVIRGLTFNETTIQKLNDGLCDKFGVDSGITVAETEEFWTDVTIDQARTPLSDVLNFVMSNFPVDDVRIVEISMENVVRKVYDGALG